jgi:hypothetical protein
VDGADENLIYPKYKYLEMYLDIVRLNAKRKLQTVVLAGSASVNMQNPKVRPSCRIYFVARNARRQDVKSVLVVNAATNLRSQKARRNTKIFTALKNARKRTKYALADTASKSMIFLKALPILRRRVFAVRSAQQTFYQNVEDFIFFIL